MRYWLLVLSVMCWGLLHASESDQHVLVRAEPDGSLVLSLVEGTPIKVSLAPKHRAGCSCCQHGVPDTHMTVTRAKEGQKRCVMPPLRQWTDPAQAIRMVKKWSHILVRAFPQYKETFFTNQAKLLATLTQLQTKWHDALRKQKHSEADSIHVDQTVNGYVEAIESWCAGSQKVMDADVQRTLPDQSASRA